MSIDGELVLPADVDFVPVLELAPEIRARIDASDRDVAITRQRSRSASSVVDEDSAALLAGFRTPTRIVDAILAFAGRRGLDPQTTLEQAYPVLSRLYRARLLVPAGSEESQAIEGRLRAGSVIDGFRLIRCVQVLNDNEVFLARDASGRFAALKYYRSPGPESRLALEREAQVLARVGSGRAPQVYALVASESGHGLITEWIRGADALAAAELLRNRGEPGREEALLTLCERVAAAFADVHDAGLLHGDAHPRNVLVESSGEVRMIDFGLARPIDSLTARDQRGGVAFYFDPQFAQAQRLGQPVAASVAAEQYSVGALLYQMWTGVHYLDWRLERDELLRQIVEDEPVTFEARRVRAWPALERILRRALSKRAEHRFSDLRSLAAALESLKPEARLRDRPPVPAAREREPQTQLRDRTLARYELAGPALRDGLPQTPRASVNYGAGGIAYALLRVAQQRGDGRWLALADVWAQKAYDLAGRDGAFFNPGIEIEPRTVGERSLFHSPAGLHCVRALVSAAQGDESTANAAMGAFVAFSQGPNPAPGPASALDAVVGKGSLLLGCAELVEAAAELAGLDRAPVIARGDELARELIEFIGAGPIGSSDAMPSLGLAHGWAGVLFALLRWSRATASAPDAALHQRLQDLAGLAEPQGAGLRWPVVFGGSSFMEGWCNGSAGHAMLFALAHELSGQAGFGVLAEGAATDAWTSDLPLGTLCCGQAGIGYALLAVHRITGSPRWLQRARACARRAAADRSAHFLQDALYKGAVGAALLAEELDQPQSAAMPLFEARR